MKEDKAKNGQQRSHGGNIASFYGQPIKSVALESNGNARPQWILVISLTAAVVAGVGEDQFGVE